MTVIGRVLAAVIASALAAAAVAQQENAKQAPAQAIDGVWELVAANVDGEQLTQNETKHTVRTFFVFVGGQLVTIYRGEVLTLSDYHADTSAMPHTLDTDNAFGWGDYRIAGSVGIFKIEEARLTISQAVLGSHERPKDFSAGKGRVLAALKRVRPADRR